MKLHQQRNELRQSVQEAYDALIALTGRIICKTGAPYGDGSYSDMVNVKSDVLPQLTEIRMKLLNTLYEVR
jgi:hypothetical protein